MTKFKRKDLIVFCAECGYEMDDPETHICPPEVTVHVQFGGDRPRAEKELRNKAVNRKAKED